MTRIWKDIAATLSTAVVVLLFAAAHEHWNVWLVGDSRRWAAAAILVVGGLTCGLGSPDRDAASTFLGVLGAAAGVLGVVALATGSLTALSFLTADIVVLWAASLVRHVARNRTPLIPRLHG
jgi:hypothetical protein